MIYLKNVRREGNRIVAEYYPELSEKFSIVSIEDTGDDSTFRGELVGYETETRSHLGMARMILREMARGKRELKDTFHYTH